MMQIQADTLGIPVLRPSMTETTSLGAAIVGKMLNNKLLIKVCIVEKFSGRTNTCYFWQTNYYTPAGMAKGINAWKTDGGVDLTMDRFLPRLTDEERDVRYERWKNIQNNSFNWIDKWEKNNELGQFTHDHNRQLTNHERFLRASVSPAIFFWTSFLVWKIAYSFSGVR